MNKKTISLIISGAVILPGLAFAQTLGSMADGLAQTALSVAGGIIVVMWVVTGILFLMAAGDPGKLGSAKTSLIAAVIGTLVIILANGAIGLVKGIFHM